MRKITRSDFPDLSDWPELPHKRAKKRHWARWVVLLGVAFAALAWKQRSVKAPGKTPNNPPADDPIADVSTWVSELESDNAPDTVASPGSTSSGDSRQEAAESAPADQSEPAEPDTESPPIIEAGTDGDGVFRPTRVESDAFGVVVTDPKPAGLNGDARWVASEGSAECPESYPIKGNASSRIYHRPGESSYEKTIPEFCFASEEDAVAAGYRPRAR